MIKIPSKPLPCIAEMHAERYVREYRERERKKPIIIATVFLLAAD